MPASVRTQVVAAGSSFGEMALHFVEKYEMMAVRIPSKFELRRFCRRALPATHLLRSGACSCCHPWGSPGTLLLHAFVQFPMHA